MKRRFFAPEVVQTSAMDCGPASLKSLLEGFGVRVSYGRLREACQTDVDGTSIDTLEDVAGQLGLDAEQVMVPADHLLLDEAAALPALVVTRLPSGLTHFVVIWRRHGSLVQVMDPGSGRRWATAEQVVSDLYQHAAQVTFADWRAWAESDDFLAPLRRRMIEIGIDRALGEQLISAALAVPGWEKVGHLDAAVRMTGAVVVAGGLHAGGEASQLLRDTLARDPSLVPEAYWSVRADPGAEMVSMRGAVLVRIAGVRAATATAAEPGRAPLSPERTAALAEAQSNPARGLFRLLAQEGAIAPLARAGALALVTIGLVVEAVLLRGLFDVGRSLVVGGQRLGVMAVLLVFSMALLCLELGISGGVLGAGRRLETRLRIAFLEKIPRLTDQYFRSRLTSDMAQRSHAVHALRQLPSLASRFVRAVFELLLTVGGIIWLDPANLPLAVTAAVLSIAVPLIAQRPLSELDLRARTHAGGLSRFYLEGLLGLSAIRAHGAERAVRREHESLIVEWAYASLAVLRTALVVDALVSLCGFGMAAWLVFAQLGHGGDSASILLLGYWALNLPVLGEEIALLGRIYPSQRNVTLRLLEPLSAPEDPHEQIAASLAPPVMKSGGAEITLAGVSVVAGGHTILDQIDLKIPAGSQLAIVGPSGAGKSSLVGILLGWHRATAGRVLVDGEPLDGPALELLRRQTAWVDPSVQLWNRSFVDNLTYGAGPDVQPIARALTEADLHGVLDKLPEGLQSSLGESGALLSGGEGQRVRFGRAVIRPAVRLVILDEAFRGLDRGKRRMLLDRCRKTWPGATLLCITHDVGETTGFPRVLVIENGRVAEDGTPEALMADPSSRYGALARADEGLRSGLWGSLWRRIRLERGKVVDR